jgi:RNA recognition motif-containing protein
MPVSYISPSPRSYFFMMSSPYMVPTSEYGSSGSASSSGAASTSDSTTSNSPPHTPVYLTEPRGVHIRNVPFETSESAIRRFVARTLQIRDDQILDVSLPTNALGKQKGYATVSFHTREMAELAKDALDGVKLRGNRLKVKTDQDWQTLYPTHYSTTSHNMSHSYPQHQSHLVETNIPQHVNLASDYSVTTMKFGDGDHGDHGDHIGQLAGANLEPEFIDPLVVDGSKNRDLPKLPSNGERSTKGKSKKDLGGDSKGKQKHKRH